MTSSAFDQFYQLVLQDDQLQEQLRDISDFHTFVLQVVALGEAHHYQFTADNVQAAMQSQRRAWLERWIR